MARKKQEELSSETRQKNIDDQVAAFLKAGGEIQEIPKGQSGYESSGGRKSIVLGSPSEKKK
ncbi:hypothetical protein H0A36_11515 [Endozoicomonas sp. SM1973]|uniref:Transcriptional regulator SutA RNAP-binding domain-containing protein n=2 Tax=Spartinivicinus TaxID=2768738 RepID=A0A853IAR8_9GAMM|nr:MULTISPECIES: hypothetical protein [Spartinivicinus]MCX4027665.1 hypothetical protein [Spartinivicinus marinus]MDE1461211.1 hypothetical protein [Spartinivicinus sp. A2-2]NYZ66637.1 hypothetical protein [Spartinivicinus marinus]